MKEQKKQNKVLLMVWTLAWVVSLAFLTGAENTLWNDLIFTKIGLINKFSYWSWYDSSS